MASGITAGSVVSRSEGWLSAWVGKEHVMMSADTGTCISLSETGGRVWELIEHPRTVEELCLELAEEFDAEAATMSADVLAFLDNMSRQHAVLIA